MIDSTGFGDGRTIALGSGRTMFMLDSFSGNPIVTPSALGLTCRVNGLVRDGAVFNPGAALFRDGIVLMPRIHTGYKKNVLLHSILPLKRFLFQNYVSRVWPLVSADGVHFERLGDSSLTGEGEEHADFVHGLEDTRIIPFRDRFLIVGTGKINPPFRGDGNDDRIAIYSTSDFESFTYHGVPLDVQSRNTIPFVDEDTGRVFMLLRFPPEKHIYMQELSGGVDQLLNPAQYRGDWQAIFSNRKRNVLLRGGILPHEREKVGAGPPAIKTERGWLLIYRGVGYVSEEIASAFGLRSALKRAYVITCALLDKDDPASVLRRSTLPLYVPNAPYELLGGSGYQVEAPRVCFPSGIVSHQGKILLYCGAGDKYTVLLTCAQDALIDHLLEHGKIPD